MTMPIYSRLALAAALVLAPTDGHAQSVTPIEAGQTVSGEAGKPADLYRFIGESGMPVNATLSAKGDAAIILYTPAGEEMLSAQGKDKTELEAVLPLWDVFYLSVIRKDLSKPFTLTLTADTPDLVQSLFAFQVGFHDSYSDVCWVEPGKVKRGKTVTGDYLQRVEPGQGYHRIFYNRAGLPLGPGFMTTVSLDGDTVTSSPAIGNPISYPLSEEMSKKPGRYKGYFCAG